MCSRVEIPGLALRLYIFEIRVPWKGRFLAPAHRVGVEIKVTDGTRQLFVDLNKYGAISASIIVWCWV
jgi:hypothetical protein